MRNTLAFLALSGVAAGCFAVSSPTSVAPSAVPRGASEFEILMNKPFRPVDPGFETRAGGGAKVVDQARATLPSGKGFDITVKRGISNAAIKTGLKTVAKALIPGVGLAVELWDMLKDKGVEKGADGTAVIDPGVGQEMRGGKMQDFRTGEPMTPGAILAREVGTACQGQSGGEANLTCEPVNAQSGCTAGTCAWSFGIIVRYSNGSIAWTNSYGDSRPELVVPSCPESTSTIPVLGNLPCPSNERVEAPDNVLDGVVDDVPSNEVPGFVKEIARALPGGLPTEDTAPEVSGPPHVDDAPVTTTKPDGSVETKTRRWDLEYPGDGTVRYTPKLIEVDGNGGETVTEGELPEGDTRTDCDKYPESIGCSEYGTPAAESVPRTNQTIGFDIVSIGNAGFCPADVSFQAFSKSYAFEMAPVCAGVVDYVKPLVLLAGAFAAAFIFAGGFKA